MTDQQQLTAVAATLSDMGLKELLDYAQFLRLKEENADWRAAARSQFAKAYSDDEPDYKEADLRTRESA